MYSLCLKETVLSAPPERIRAGKICVTVTQTYNVLNGTEVIDCVRSSGFGLCDLDNTSSMEAAHESACKMAFKIAQEIVGKMGQGTKALSAVIKEAIQPATALLAAEKEELFVKEGRDVSWIDALFAPADEGMQNTIFNLSETLGITPINVLDPDLGFTKTDAQVIIEALTKKVKMFEFVEK
jgi:hypothetical protein